VISFINQRPAIQIGPYQVLDYDTDWLEDAILRAAKEADHENFSMAPEIRQGVEMYLESKCSLRLLHLEDLFERVRKIAQILRGKSKWNKHCDALLEEIRVFLAACDRESEEFSRALSLSIE
jgi:hypothetical protein